MGQAQWKTICKCQHKPSFALHLEYWIGLFKYCELKVHVWDENIRYYIIKISKQINSKRAKIKYFNFEFHSEAKRYINSTESAFIVNRKNERLILA